VEATPTQCAPSCEEVRNAAMAPCAASTATRGAPPLASENGNVAAAAAVVRSVVMAEGAVTSCRALRGVQGRYAIREAWQRWHVQ